MNRPNILLILTDQQSASMMSCAGNAHLATPAMDGLAAEGVRFERAYCTNPVCVPSRFSLMTGRMPSEIGMLSNSAKHLESVPAGIREQGLGFLLRAAGYETAYAGKEHLPKMRAPDVGFDYICPDERDGLADAAAGFLVRPHDRPFCLVASFINPHDICYMSLREFTRDSRELEWLPKAVAEQAALDAALRPPAGANEADFPARLCPPLPPNFEPQADEPEAIRTMLEHRPFKLRARQEWDEAAWRRHRWAYARLTEAVDRQIGRVLDALRASGADEHTLVVFTSDHGDMDAAHRLEHKSTLYEEACRIPLIVRPPGGMRPGRADREHLVSNGLDLLPTLCDWAGAPAPAGLAGRSLRSLVEGRTVDGWRSFVPVECVIGRAIVTRTHKYGRCHLGANAEQLIDLRRDPGEARNAIGDADQASAAAELREAHRRFFGESAPNERDVVRVLFDA